jgi:hypothetical protein
MDDIDSMRGGDSAAGQAGALLPRSLLHLEAYCCSPALVGHSQLYSYGCQSCACAFCCESSSMLAGTTLWLLQKMLTGSYCCLTCLSLLRLEENMTREPGWSLQLLV